ncbi:hypothetical protein RiCNE_02500 [Rickettsia endosymbiont of Culicoides newsteadi]|nr:hypothetical protein RiCNE_02500 [Rickettsia endosymbiont of Culicoides newsteadi]
MDCHAHICSLAMTCMHLKRHCEESFYDDEAIRFCVISALSVTPASVRGLDSRLRENDNSGWK